MDPKLLADLRKFLATRPEVELAVVFGSQAKGTANSKSDVDIAISLGRKLTPDEYSGYVLGFSTACGKEIDVVDLHQADSLISRQALTEGVLLSEREPQVFAKLLMRALLHEADLGPARAKILAARRKTAFGED